MTSSQRDINTNISHLCHMLLLIIMTHVLLNDFLLTDPLVTLLAISY